MTDTTKRPRVHVTERDGASVLVMPVDDLHRTLARLVAAGAVVILVAVAGALWPPLAPHRPWLWAAAAAMLGTVIVRLSRPPYRLLVQDGRFVLFRRTPARPLAAGARHELRVVTAPHGLELWGRQRRLVALTALGARDVDVIESFVGEAW